MAFSIRCLGGPCSMQLIFANGLPLWLELFQLCTKEIALVSTTYISGLVGVVEAGWHDQSMHVAEKCSHDADFRVDWNNEKTLQENYTKNGFTNSLKKTHGRNAEENKRKEKTLQMTMVRTYSRANMDNCPDVVRLITELRALNNLQRKTGKAAPKRLTPHQKQIISRLIEAHGGDVEAMARNRKLNDMQHSEGKLRMMLESHEYWRGKTGVDFRGCSSLNISLVLAVRLYSLDIAATRGVA
eukprot:scaffold79458_cov46-Prasinocladus_malaysianus.AAC.2